MPKINYLREIDRQRNKNDQKSEEPDSPQSVFEEDGVKFTYRDFLGEGTTGVVRLFTNHEEEQERAVKHLHPIIDTFDPEMKKSSVKEFSFYQKAYPDLEVNLVQFDEETYDYRLIMPYLGVNLATVIMSEDVTVTDVTEILITAVDELERIHTKLNIALGDIVLGNIVVNESNEVFFIDAEEWIGRDHTDFASMLKGDLEGMLDVINLSLSQVSDCDEEMLEDEVRAVNRTDGYSYQNLRNHINKFVPILDSPKRFTP